LELLAVQTLYQLQDELVVDVGVFGLVVRVNHHSLDRTPIDHDMHLVAAASLHIGKTIAEVAGFSKSPYAARILTSTIMTLVRKQPT